MLRQKMNNLTERNNGHGKSLPVPHELNTVLNTNYRRVELFVS